MKQPIPPSYRQTKRRVLILDENLSVPFDRRVWREATALCSAGYRVTVICPKGAKRDTESFVELDGIAIFRYRPIESTTDGLLAYLIEWGYALLAMTVLAFLVSLQRGFDVIQLCNPPDLLFLVALPYKLFGARVIFDHHDLSPEVYTSKAPAKKGNLVHKILFLLERLTFASADKVLSTNESFREIALSRGGKRPEDVFVVRNGPSIEELHAVEPLPDLREGKRHLLLYVGIMAAQDGVDLLLRAVSELAALRDRADFLLVLVGDGPEFENVQALAKELCIEDRVRFRGRLPFSEVLRCIAGADICLCPDPYTEMNDKSTLVKVVEYMSLAKPTVAFDLSETRLSAGESALYAEPNDPAAFAACINTLMDSEDLGRRMGMRGEEAVRTRLAWDYSKRSLLDAYEAVARAREKRAYAVAAE